jgi:steroid delta-isomerase-like uncharacterized protein
MKGGFQVSEELKAKCLRWIEAWNTGNLDMLDEVFASDSVYHVPPFPDLPSLEAHKQFIADSRRSYPDFHLTLDEIIIEGNTTAMRWTWQGTYTGPSSSLPVPPTGKQGKVLGCHVVHWEDGKVVEAWHIGDWLGLLQQFGVLPPMG